MPISLLTNNSKELSYEKFNKTLLVTSCYLYQSEYFVFAINSAWLTNTYVTAFAVSGLNLFAGTYGRISIFFSTNNGTSWINDGLTNVFAFAVIDANVFAATGGGGVFLSTNNGTSWNAVNNGIPNGYGVQSFAVSVSNFFAAGSGVFLSTNNGTSLD